MVKFHRATQVEAIGIEAELSNLCRSTVEIVTRIKSVIAIEFPSRSVQLLAARLDHLSDVCRGRKAIFSALVGSQVKELGNGIERRHNAGAATTAVKVFTAVNQLQVVTGSLPIDAYAVITADCSWSDEIAL